MGSATPGRVRVERGIYRQRMGQQPSSLKAIAVGAAPVYDRQDEILALTVSDGA